MKRKAARRKPRRRNRRARADRAPASPTTPVAKVDSQALAVGVVAVLLGAGAAVTLAGEVAAFASVYDPTPPTCLTAIAIALFCAAVGTWIPQRLVAAFVQSAWLRMRSIARLDRGSIETILAHRAAGDASLAWLLLSATLTAVGLGALVVPLAVRWATRLDHFLVSSFLWNNGTLRVVEGTVMLFVLAMPWVMIGVALACTYSCATLRWSSTRSAAPLVSLVSVGVATGWYVGWQWILPISGAAVLLLVGTLPMLLAALLAGSLVGRRERAEAGRAAPAESPPPEEGEELTRLLLASLAVWGAVVGASIVAWDRVAAVGLVTVRGWPSVGSWLLLFLSGGMAAGGLRAARSKRSVGEYGVVVAGMGVTQAAVLVVAGWACWSAGPAVGTGAGQRGVWMMLLGAAAFSSGAVLPYGKRALMARSGSEMLTQAQMVSVALAGSAVGMMVSGWFLVPTIGILATLSGSALLILAMGGTLIIQEQTSSSRRTAARVGGLFLAMLVLTALFPWAVSRWSVVESRTRASPRGAPWLARALPLLDVRAGSACGVGLAAVDTGLLVVQGFDRVDLMSCGTWAAGRPDQGRSASCRIVRIERPLPRVLRLGRRCYDGIFIDAAGAEVGTHGNLWAAETLRRLRGMLTPGGRVVVRLPLTGMSDSAVAMVARGFRVVFGEYCGWTANPERGPDPSIWLVGAAGGLRVPSGGPHSPSILRLAELTGPRSAPQDVHSIWSPRLPRVLRRGGGAARKYERLRRIAKGTLRAGPALASGL